MHKFTDFLDSDFNIITQHDPLDEKLGIKLFDPELDENLPLEITDLDNEFVQDNAVDNDSNNPNVESDSDSSDDESDGTKLRSGKRVRFEN